MFETLFCEEVIKAEIWDKDAPVEWLQFLSAFSRKRLPLFREQIEFLIHFNVFI